MTTHRFINWALAFAAAISIGAIAAMEAEDIELEREMSQERREWHAAVSVCTRMYGPSTQPEYRDDGHLVCVSRRGEVLPYRVAAK